MAAKEKAKGEEKKGAEEKGGMAKEKKREPAKLVRIAHTDIDGKLPLRYALKRIRGIGHGMANALCILSGIEPMKKSADLTPDEIRLIEQTIQQQESSPSLPSWMLNRRRDLGSGKDFHLAGEKLKMRVFDDINFLKRIRAYRGIRHELGLPVRGQRTHMGGKGRRGGAVGVVKAKAAMPGAAPAGAPGAPGAKPAAGAPAAAAQAQAPAAKAEGKK